MLEEIRKEFTLFKLLVFLLTVAVSIYLFGILWQFLSIFSDVIVITVIAWLLSFILEPLVDLICKMTRLAKVWSALIVYAFFALLFTITIILFVPVVVGEFQSLAKIAPTYLASFPKFIQTWNNAITNSVNTLISLVPSIATVFIDIIFILILSFYFIIDKEKMNSELYKLAPKTWHENLRFIQKTIDETFASFLRIQLIFGIIAGVSTWIVLRIFGIDFAASIALLAGILTIIPMVGPILGILPPAFVALALHPDNPILAAAIFAILLLVQQIVANVVGPKLMERAFKLHPIIVFLSIIIGFKVAGPLGAVFVVPVLGIVVIVIKKLGYHFLSPEETKA